MQNSDNPSDALKIYELSLIWKEATYNFGRWAKRQNLDWDAAYKEALTQVLATNNLRDYYRELMRFTALLQDGHTDVTLPDLIESSAEYTSKLPIRCIYHQGEYVVENVKNVAKNTIKRWSIIKKINGTDIHAYMEQNIFPYIWHEKPDSAFWRIWHIFNQGSNGEQVTFEFECEGETYNTVLTRTKGDIDWVYDSATMDHAEPMDVIYESDSHKIAITKDNIAVITIPTFENDKLPEEFAANFALLEKAAGYVIDVRYNGGGNSGNGNAVISAFVEGSFTADRVLMPVHIAPYKAWAQHTDFGDMTYEEVVKKASEESDFIDSNWLERVYKIPRGMYFEELTYNTEHTGLYPGVLKKPLVVLCTCNTGSAAEDFLLGLDHTKRATFVGTATNGSTGQPLMLPLESGGKVRICTMTCTYPDGREFIDIGVQPHIHFEPSLEDIKTGIDSHMAKGLDVLRMSF